MGPLSCSAVVRRARPRVLLLGSSLEDGNRVLPTTAAECGTPISAGEIQDTCDMLPKSPGPYLIPNAFYKIFSAKVTPILERCSCKRVRGRSTCASAFTDPRGRGTSPPASPPSTSTSRGCASSRASATLRSSSHASSSSPRCSPSARSATDAASPTGSVSASTPSRGNGGNPAPSHPCL